MGLLTKYVFICYKTIKQLTMYNFILIACAFFFWGNLSAQTTSWMVEAQVVVSPEEEKPVYAQPWVWGSKKFKDSPWGIGCFASQREYWGEILVGPSYTFKPDGKVSLEIGTQIGIETYDPLPYCGLVYTFCKIKGKEGGLHDFTYLLAAEYAGSNPWTLVLANYNITRRFGIGVIAQYEAVIGPRLQINIPSGCIWMAGGRDVDNYAPGGAFGLRFFM